MKTYPAAVESLIDSGNLTITHGLKMSFSTPLLITDGGFDVDDDGDVYVVSGVLNGIGSIARESGLSVTELELSFSMVNQTIVGAIYGEPYHNTPVEIIRFFVDDDGAILHRETIWKGSISKFVDSDNSGSMTITVENIFADFEQVNSWKTTPSSHKRRYPYDDCFRFAAKASETIYWAGERIAGTGVSNGTNKRKSIGLL